jgi:flagellar protein FlaG
MDVQAVSTVAVPDVSPVKPAQVKEPAPEASVTGQKKPAEEKESKKLSVTKLSGMVNQINDFVSTINTKIAFEIDKETGKSVIVVVEKDSGKVIRTIPEKEMLELTRKMQEIAGIIYNRRA